MDNRQELQNLKGKHIKQVLTKLEALNTLTPPVRKVVLDEINDLMREIFRVLYGDE
jgi:hypothetical protein